MYNLIYMFLTVHFYALTVALASSRAYILEICVRIAFCRTHLCGSGVRITWEWRMYLQHSLSPLSSICCLTHLVLSSSFLQLVQSHLHIEELSYWTIVVFVSSWFLLNTASVCITMHIISRLRSLPDWSLCLVWLPWDLLREDLCVQMSFLSVLESFRS